MPRHQSSINMTNYHYRVDILDTINDNKLIGSKYYFTRKEMCDEYSISAQTMYKMMKNPNRNTRNPNLKGVRFYRDTQPALIRCYKKNEDIYGTLDEVDQ